MNDAYPSRYTQDNLAVLPSLAGAGPSAGVSGPPPSHHGGVDLGPSPIKRSRPNEQPDLTQPLHVDVEIKRVISIVNLGLANVQINFY